METPSYERFRTFWHRLGASLIDGVVVGPVAWPTTILVGYGPLPVAIAWIIAVCPAGFVYTSYCHGRWGKTLGKHAVGIKVVRQEDEGPLGYSRAVLRDAGSILFAVAGTAILVAFLLNDGDRDSFRIFDQQQFQVRTREELETQTPGEVFRESFADALPPGCPRVPVGVAPGRARDDGLEPAPARPARLDRWERGCEGPADREDDAAVFAGGCATFRRRVLRIRFRATGSG